MMYFDFEAGNKTYKLRLDIRNTVALEKRIGCNPLAVFGVGDRIPTINEMVSILHYSLQKYEHGISYDDSMNIFEEWLEDGHTVTDFINVIVSVYKVSGIIKDTNNAEDSDEKN